MTEANVRHQPSCADALDAGAVPVDQARTRILDTVSAVGGRARVAVRSALGRILSEAMVSPRNVPAHTNAAMDGYAVQSRDLPREGTREFQVPGTAWAGVPYESAAGPGEAVRIMTGAVIPRGCDTVVMQEQTELRGDRVLIGSGHRQGQNVRAAGEDLREGQVVFEAGHRLLPADIGLLASLGIAEVPVRRRLRVAFFSTGDELRSVGQPLEEGQVYDSNRYTLYAMLRRLEVDVLDLGVVPDRADAIREAFRDATENADAVITSGGVSVGEADYVKETLNAIGEVDFWKIAMKPGRPMAFGRVGNSCFFGLPGNPVAVMVTFYQFVQPALRKMMGQTPGAPVRFRVPCRSALKKKPGRTEFQRGRLFQDETGRLTVERTGAQGSGILSSMSKADCFIVLEPERDEVRPGDEVDVEPFHGLV